MYLCVRVVVSVSVSVCECVWIHYRLFFLISFKQVQRGSDMNGGMILVLVLLIAVIGKFS